MGNVFLHLKINLKKTLSLITLKRYSNQHRYIPQVSAEFGACGLKALGGDTFGILSQKNNNNKNKNKNKFK